MFPVFDYWSFLLSVCNMTVLQYMHKHVFACTVYTVLHLHGLKHVSHIINTIIFHFNFFFNAQEIGLVGTGITSWLCCCQSEFNKLQIFTSMIM